MASYAIAMGTTHVHNHNCQIRHTCGRYYYYIQKLSHWNNLLHKEKNKICTRVTKTKQKTHEYFQLLSPKFKGWF